MITALPSLSDPYATGGPMAKTQRPTREISALPSSLLALFFCRRTFANTLSLNAPHPKLIQNRRRDERREAEPKYDRTAMTEQSKDHF